MGAADLDPASGHEGFKVTARYANMPPQPREGDPPLCDQSTDKAGRRAQTLRSLLDIQQGVHPWVSLQGAANGRRQFLTSHSPFLAGPGGGGLGEPGVARGAVADADEPPVPEDDGGVVAQRGCSPASRCRCRVHSSRARRRAVKVVE